MKPKYTYIPRYITLDKKKLTNDEYNSMPTDSKDIADKLELTHNNAAKNVEQHQQSLVIYTQNTRDIWLGYFKG